MDSNQVGRWKTTKGRNEGFFVERWTREEKMLDLYFYAERGGRRQVERASDDLRLPVDRDVADYGFDDVFGPSMEDA